jgi:hypothetical protein
MNIDELIRMRSNLVHSIKENGSEGIYKLLTELYPENAHFIYELLQNAEDTGATKVSFVLNNDVLEYCHNGERLFDITDIDKITNFADSTKADDITKIGKFGIGFKAVFAYTATPIIYSGEYSFQINDFLVPQIVNDIDRNKNQTIMKFPFNNPKKLLKQAYNEVKLGLEKLHDNTLLFLQNITEIHFTIENDQYFIKRNEIDEIQVEIRNSQKNSLSRWLRFKKSLPDNPVFYVSAAYKICENEKTAIDEIVPITGEVSIFFPAEKETSKLKFHIHAPFLSTVARDSMKDLDENKTLINLISETVAESLKYLKTNDLLTMSFLEVLPNQQDDALSDIYLPIYEKCIETFRTKELMLTESGSFQPANICYRGSANLKKLIDDNDLCTLLEKKNIYWSKNAPQKNNRADKFIMNLGIQEFSDEDFIALVANMRREKIQDFFSLKSDEWYLNFYVFLFHNSKNINIQKFKAIIKLSDNSINIDSQDCYFERGFKVDGLSYVKTETYMIPKKEEDNKRAEQFLTSLGVKDVELEDEIFYLLRRYEKNNFPSFEEHIDHLRHILIYFDAGGDVTLFKEKIFLSCIDKHNETEWENDFSNVYIDEPFEKTGLKVLPDALVPDERYFKEFLKNEQEDFLKFLLKLGVKNKLEIISVNVKENPYFDIKLKGDGRSSKNEEGSDWSIENLDELLTSNSVEISKIIWGTILIAPEKYQKSSYRSSRQQDMKYADSQLNYFLKNYAWIPDDNGQFYKPRDITPESVHSDFNYEDSNRWLKAIGFFDNPNNTNNNDDPINKIVEERTGLSMEMLEEAKKAGVTVKDILALIEKKDAQRLGMDYGGTPKSLKESLDQDSGNGNSKEFANNSDSSSMIIDDDQYMADAQRDREENKDSAKIKTVKSKTQDKKKIERLRTFLRNEYDGHCQICGDTFKYNGENYFRISSLNKGENRDINVKGNTLCLCPKHWTLFELDLRELTFWENIKDRDGLTVDDFEKAFGMRYDFFSPLEVKEAFYNLPEGDDFSRDEIRLLPIKIFGKTEYIKITERHEREIIIELNRK